MSALLATALAAATLGPPVPVSGRIEGLALVSFQGRYAVRISYSGRPGKVSVARDGGNLARVTMAQTELGWRFGAAGRFEWRPAQTPSPTFAVAGQSLDVLRVGQARGETSLEFELPPGVSIDLRQARDAILVVLREAGTPGTLVAQAPQPTSPAPPRVAPPAPQPPPQPTPPPAARPVPAPTPAPMPEPTPPAAPEPAPPAPTPGPPPEAGVAASRSDLYRQLFPGATPAPTLAAATESDDPAVLYSRLFPAGATQEGAPQEEIAIFEKAPEPEEGLRAGPFRLRPNFTLSYVNADASLLETPGTVNDRYFQFEPGIVARAPVREGVFTAEYTPAFRAGASFAATQKPTHVFTGSLDVPFGSGSQLSVSDRYVVSTLDSREVDPGGEYFFDLARFNRNLLSANARLAVAPRFFVEVGGALNRISFEEQGGFFSYDSRLASVGLGYELSPTLRASASYVYDQVPTPEERPEAEASANSARVTLQGDLLPLLTGQLSMGYRDQKSPNAGDGGQRYQGFTMSGSLTRELGRETAVSLLLNRSTPVSNFESQGFYVNTSLHGSLVTALPWELGLEAGAGYAWNDYDLPSLETALPREDRIFDLYAGLRRSFGRHWWASAFYRRQQRYSNLDEFDTISDGFVVQVNWGLFGPRR